MLIIGKKLLLLLLLLLLFPLSLSPSLPLYFPGYSQIHFVTQPQDVYTTTSLNIAYFQCKAEGILISSGKQQLLDVRFLRDNVSLSSKFSPAPRHSYEVQGNGDYVVGVVIDPIEPSADNGRLYKCQVRINGVGIDLFSDTAELVVGGEFNIASLILLMRIIIILSLKVWIQYCTTLYWMYHRLVYHLYTIYTCTCRWS